MPFLYPLLAQALPFQESPVSFGWLFFKTMAVLIFVIVLAIVVIRVVFPKLQGKVFQGRSSIRILDKLPLDARKSLWVVQVGKKMALEGLSEQGVTKILDLDETDLEVKS
jgi:flagellar biogenesis protein FliO